MSRFAVYLRGVLLLLPVLAIPAFADDEAGFTPLFDGKSLDGWNGNPDFWSVKDGAITGQTTAEKPTKGNTFIIWKKGEVGDFELRLQFKIIGGNSGVQYRSQEVDKWVIKGYQADFDGAGSWAGTLYEEKGRGVLAKRGQKVEVGTDGKPKEVGKTAEEKQIVDSLKKEDWNDYVIIADGNHLVQKLNGITTVDLVDNDAKNRRAEGLLALQLHAGPPMTVQFKNIRIKKLGDAKKEEKKEAGNGGDCQERGKIENVNPTAVGVSVKKGKKIVFVAGKPSHGYGAHEHNAGCLLLAKELKAAMPEYTTEVALNGWPQDTKIFDGADCIIMYCDGGGGHMVVPHLDEVDALAKKGVGIVCVHYGVEVEKGKPGDRFLDWIGGYFEMNWSVNPHWTAKYEKFPDHPISRGVKPFEINDEWYYHMRFRPEMKGVTPILTALPPKDTLARPDGPHSGNPAVREDVAKGNAQHMAWAAEREGGGRGFGFTGGHDHWNWGDPNFRKVVLNAIVWCAHGEVPKNGVESPAVTLKTLEANQDYPQPANFNRESIIKQKGLPADEAGSKTEKPKQSAAPGAKPVFAGKMIDARTAGHSIDIEADITGAKELYLVVTDGGDGFGCDWSDWCEPRLIGPKGEKKLTELKWKSASSQFGEVTANKTCSGGALKVNGKSVEFGIGTHANSVIAFDLPEGFTKFKARGGLDNGGTDQGCGSSVQFLVYTQKPPAIESTVAGASSISRDAGDAVANLDIADGLEATLFSSEPQISNITNIDIDHLGRVWAAEVKNYRKFNGSRPEGDRILVLEDTDGDGKADKQTVFYQGRDIDSVHGICVLGNRVIVSANDKVQVFTDENGDLKSDKKETLFSGISGTQHDHGIHAFVFGPDGKLYFNFGNSGNQIKDKNGKQIVDKAGNEVVANRKPYQEGMVFRCNLDGSELETLGWNFRNNWEVAVDSFGSLWQSDNDDDGNKGVRINFVMEFGNYGYKDEFTGAGWQQPRENWEKEIPLRHWHLNDPGVVPNLIQTGAGSPTGICFNEGTLLGSPFTNQVIHCDAGPSIVRAYVTKKSGAGYSAEIVNILEGKRDNWFRPSDVCIAPDGSLFVSDWYDPGVGGHNQQEVDKGRIFRVFPKGSAKYQVAKIDLATPAGALSALDSPNLETRYLAFTALVAMGDKAHHAIEEHAEKAKDPRSKARALFLLAKLPGEAEEAVEVAIKDADPDVRIVGIRIAREQKMDIAKVGSLIGDKSTEVRRELAISLRHNKSPQAPELWGQLAAQYDGKDRWYLEALGIGADKQWDTYLAAYLKSAGDSAVSTAPGRDIIWRSRAKQTPALLAKILKDPATKEADQPRYLRAFDFLTGPEKEAALKSLAE